MANVWDTPILFFVYAFTPKKIRLILLLHLKYTRFCRGQIKVFLSSQILPQVETRFKSASVAQKRSERCETHKSWDFTFTWYNWHLAFQICQPLKWGHSHMLLVSSFMLVHFHSILELGLCQTISALNQKVVALLSFFVKVRILKLGVLA